MNAKTLLPLVALMAACGQEAASEVDPSVTILDGFTTDRGEEVSFIVSETEEGTDVVVRTKHSAEMLSTIAPLAQEVSPLELWYTYAEGEPPAALWDHFIQQGGVMPMPREAVIDTADQIASAIVTESLLLGQGDCSAFAAGYTWSQRYVSGTVTAGVTAGLAEMEHFVTGACNKSSNDASDQLTVYLDRWTSAISGWNVYFSEVIVRGEAVQYSRFESNCSYYQHRLRVVPSTVAGTVSYRYAGQWYEETCGVIIGG